MTFCVIIELLLCQQEENALVIHLVGGGVSRKFQYCFWNQGNLRTQEKKRRVKSTLHSSLAG